MISRHLHGKGSQPEHKHLTVMNGHWFPLEKVLWSNNRFHYGVEREEPQKEKFLIYIQLLEGECESRLGT